MLQLLVFFFRKLVCWIFFFFYTRHLSKTTRVLLTLQVTGGGENERQLEGGRCGWIELREAGAPCVRQSDPHSRKRNLIFGMIQRRYHCQVKVINRAVKSSEDVIKIFIFFFILFFFHNLLNIFHSVLILPLSFLISVGLDCGDSKCLSYFYVQRISVVNHGSQGACVSHIYMSL